MSWTLLYGRSERPGITNDVTFTLKPPQITEYSPSVTNRLERQSSEPCSIRGLGGIDFIDPGAMDEPEHWMTRQLRLVEEESKNWPAWRQEEARIRFGIDSE